MLNDEGINNQVTILIDFNILQFHILRFFIHVLVLRRYPSPWYLCSTEFTAPSDYISLP